jgi:hypothetical protein
MSKKLFILVVLLLVCSSALSQADNYAIRLDGVDDYIEVPHHSSFDWNQQATIECWVKLFDSNGGRVFNKWRFAVEDKQLRFDDTRKVTFHLHGLEPPGINRWSPTVLNVDQWYHITGTARGDSLYIYINGYLDTCWAASGGWIGNSTDPARIGAAYNRPGCGPISGEIDELRIWNVYKTPEEIRSMMFQEASGNEPGLVAVWHFNEGQGQIAYDSSPNHNNGRLGSSTGGDPQDPQWILSTSPINTPDSIPFAPAVNYGACNQPISVFCADLDGDGDRDLAVANYWSDNVSILKNNGDGTFQTKLDYVTGIHPSSVFCADLDGDGDMDLAVANAGSDNVSILKNNGDGTFQTKVDYPAGDRPFSVFCADLDRDGDVDIAVSHGWSDSVSILKNNGNGIFQLDSNYVAGDSATSVFCADLDGDGDMDLAVANEYSHNVSIFKNNGDGTFQTKVDYSAGIQPMSVFCADLDGDGHLDLAVANYGSDNVSILKNNGDGTFQTKLDYPAGDRPTSVFCADLDGDNYLDLAVANHNSDNISIMKNNGDGSFRSEVKYRVGTYPSSVFCADLDGDQDLDLAVANWLSNNVSILKNLSNQPIPGTIAGNIKDASTQQDLQGVLVEALQEAQVKGGDSTDVNGDYSIPNLALGTYDVRASKWGYETQTQNGKVVNAGQTTTIDFQLIPLATGIVSGFVYDGCTSSGLGGVLVEFWQDEVVRYSATTETPTGLYELSGVFAGTYDVRYSKAGYNTQIFEKTIEPGWNLLQTVTLIPIGYISSKPLKDAMDNFCNAYYNYMDKMADGVLAMTVLQLEYLYDPDLTLGKAFTKAILGEWQKGTTDAVLSGTIELVEEWERKRFYHGLGGAGMASADEVADYLVWAGFEAGVDKTYNDILGFIDKGPAIGQEIKDALLVPFLENPSPINNEHIVSINDVLEAMNLNKSSDIPNCLPSDFPFDQFVSDLQTITSVLQKVTLSDVFNPPLGCFDVSQHINGYCNMDANTQHTLGLFNLKMREVKQQYEEFTDVDLRTKQIRGVCKEVGGASTVFKASSFLAGHAFDWGQKGFAAMDYMSAVVIGCNIGTFLTGAITTCAEADYAMSFTDFVMFWPPYYASSFRFFNAITDPIVNAAKNPSLLNCSKKFNATLFLPSEVCVPLLQAFERVDGIVSVTNLDNQKVGKVMVYGSVYMGNETTKEPNDVIRADVTDISADGTVDIPISFNVLSPGLPNIPFYFNIDIELVTSGQKISLPTKQLKVTVAPECSGPAPYMNVANLSMQKIGEKQTLSTDFTTSPTSKSAVFSMKFGGSDIDLHLYDQGGNHVGRNYQTGQIELQIPGAEFLGDSTNSEAIVIPTIPGATYQVKAFGVCLPDSEIVTIDVFETIQADPNLSTFPQQIFIDVFQGDSVCFSGSLFDRSGQNQLSIDTATCSNFVDSLGHTMPASLIGISYPNIIPVDSTINYLLHVNVPYSQLVGLYTGTLTFRTASDTIYIPVSIKIIASYTRGDAKGDGSINLADVIYLANYVLKGGPSPIPPEAGDVNCDGRIDLVDVILLARYVLLGEPFPC